MKLIKDTTELKPWQAYKKKPVQIIAHKLKEEVFIETLEGVMKGNKGDYLIQGIHGELYPCKPKIFKKTYEKV